MSGFDTTPSGDRPARRAAGGWDRFLGACIATVCLAAAPASPVARQVSHCEEAARFLEKDMGLAVVTEPDTLDDWRTGRRQPGCRVTASGLTAAGVAEEAIRFYEQVRQAGWTRTPDPRDSPNEASLRFRKRGSDCLFNVYEGVLLMTEAERKVSSATVPTPGRTRYGVFVMCMAALPAAPRAALNSAMSS